MVSRGKAAATVGTWIALGTLTACQQTPISPSSQAAQQEDAQQELPAGGAGARQHAGGRAKGSPARSFGAQAAGTCLVLTGSTSPIESWRVAEISTPIPMSPASKTLPLGTTAKVTNLANGKSATLVVGDRGPFIDGRVVDVTPKVASELEIRESGVAPVVVAPIAVPQADGTVKALAREPRR